MSSSSGELSSEYINAIKAIALITSLIIIGLALTGGLFKMKLVRLAIGGLLCTFLIALMRTRWLFKALLTVLLWIVITLMYIYTSTFTAQLLLAIIIIVIVGLAWFYRPKTINVGESSSK